MNFSINLEFFLDRISDDIHKNLMTEHHNLITENKEALNKYIKFKKDLLNLYQQYNFNITKNKNINFNKKYFDIIKFMHELEVNIKFLEHNAINQKELYKNNKFYFTNFK